MTDVSTTTNINSVYDHKFLFFSFFYFVRKTAFFFMKQEYMTVRQLFFMKEKVYDCKINKSCNIMYGKRFVLKKTLTILST